MRLFVCAALLCAGIAPAETWHGLRVAPGQRCSPYRAGDCSYPQSVEPLVVAQTGKVYGLYTGRCVASPSETDIEHLVARSVQRQQGEGDHGAEAGDGDEARGGESRKGC